MSSQDISIKEKKTPGEQVSQERAITPEEQVVVSTETENMVHQREELVDSKDERIAELEAVLNQTQQRERDHLLRAKAEIENILRRSEQDVEKAHKFALERFVGELLPVIDNLERALEMSDKSNTELAPTIEGIELTLKSLLDAGRKFGLDIVSEKDVTFNPEVHQAMTMLESDHDEANKVMMVMQKGYILNGRLIRPAMVAVSKAKS